MELRDYIEEGEKTAGSVKELCKRLGLAHPSYLSNAKQGQRGLPLAACYKLADLIEVSHDAVAAASALVTEKDESVREYLRPFAQAVRHAQHLTIALIAGGTALEMSLENSINAFRDFLL